MPRYNPIAVAVVAMKKSSDAIKHFAGRTGTAAPDDTFCVISSFDASLSAIGRMGTAAPDDTSFFFFLKKKSGIYIPLRTEYMRRS